MTLTRLESFPFDSRYDGYDDEGYPVYDRAVGAATMRDVFARFFSDGVFSDTTYPFRLTKAASGLAVTVNPGVIIINGGWGILPEATTLTLATGTTPGVIKYAVFARYDNNDEHRTLYLRTDASSAGGAVPEPSTTEANVTEYRIGYVTVPSNSSDLANATVTNEVGTSKCPYAVPLFDIDPAEVLEDLRQDAQAAYDKYYALLKSALDGTTAGELANRISALEEKEIDPQALRSEMGLGNTLGVLGVEYGGTGRNSEPTTGLVCSFDLSAKVDLAPGEHTKGVYSFTSGISFNNIFVEDEEIASFSDGVLSIDAPGFYKISVTGDCGVDGYGVRFSTGYAVSSEHLIKAKIPVGATGDLYGLPNAEDSNPFGAFSDFAITKKTTTTSGSASWYASTLSVSEEARVIGSVYEGFKATFPASVKFYPSGSFDTKNAYLFNLSSSQESALFANLTVEVYRVRAI